MLTFKISLDLSGAAGLGVSVKGKSRSTSEQGRDSPQDKGIFVKSIIPGGAAAKDNRLYPDDQLLRVNNKSLVGLTNQAAMETLRLAMQSTRPNQAFIDVTIAREQDEIIPPSGKLLQSRSLEELNAPDQERPIEAVSVEESQRGTSETDGGVPNKEREFLFTVCSTTCQLTPFTRLNAHPWMCYFNKHILFVLWKRGVLMVSALRFERFGFESWRPFLESPGNFSGP